MRQGGQSSVRMEPELENSRGGAYKESLSGQVEPSCFLSWCEARLASRMNNFTLVQRNNIHQIESHNDTDSVC